MFQRYIKINGKIKYFSRPNIKSIITNPESFLMCDPTTHIFGFIWSKKRSPKSLSCFLLFGQNKSIRKTFLNVQVNRPVGFLLYRTCGRLFLSSRLGLLCFLHISSFGNKSHCTAVSGVYSQVSMHRAVVQIHFPHIPLCWWLAACFSLYFWWHELFCWRQGGAVIMDGYRALEDYVLEDRPISVPPPIHPKVWKTAASPMGQDLPIHSTAFHHFFPWWIKERQQFFPLSLHIPTFSSQRIFGGFGTVGGMGEFQCVNSGLFY